jgi:hypothetical protein
MGIESSVYDAFNSTSNGNVKANHLVATGLALHSIYGHPTWVVSYENANGTPSFQGLGLLSAYSTSGNDVAFGDTKEEALQNYLTELATGTNNGAPPSGGSFQTLSGVISQITANVEGGQDYYYFELSGDATHVYRVQAGSANPSILFAKVGQHVTVSFLNLNLQTAVRNVSSFSDADVPLGS